jgi:peptidoglycan L-alanyl-D-glutamate endopeptidase CwlK
MALDILTVERIKTMHPDERKELLEDYAYVNEKLLGKGVRLRFAYTYRTPAEQDQIFKQRPKVTNAKGWQSIHNYGLAFDIVLLYDLDNNGTFETASWDMKKDFDNDKVADWMEVTNYFKSKGWEWGGDWKNFKDAPHFQKVKGLTWQALKEKVDKGIVIKDCNKITYPKI